VRGVPEEEIEKSISSEGWEVSRGIRQALADVKEWLGFVPGDDPSRYTDTLTKEREQIFTRARY